MEGDTGDAAMVEMMRQAARSLAAGAGESGFVVFIDGVRLVVGVERSTRQDVR